jgi:beta-N-acetylhexosaminidase
MNGFGSWNMSVELSLKAAPYHLNDADIAWVQKTRDGLSTEAKVRQLFVHISKGDDLDMARRLGGMAPGGIHRFMGQNLDEAWSATRLMLEMNEVPLFITGDIEGGGHGSSAMLQFPNQLGLAAANDLELSARLLSAVVVEAKSFGFNWSFTPVVDVNKESGSAIVGTRSYGSDIEKIIAQARIHVKTLQGLGIAATAKHWPGEGYDSRDQHLVTTINPLGVDAWQEVFGRIYKSMITDGIMTVMSAHIALPAYAAKHGITGLARYRPASVSRLLNQSLLRDELGFNGLVVSDATPMGGLTAWDKRSICVPEVIENGCDIFLFSPNEEQDFKHMMDGLRDGRLSEQRLEDSVTRILGLKAAIGLHKKSLDERLPPLADAKMKVNAQKHLDIAQSAADRSITLVKDTQSLLPLNIAKHKRITLVHRGSPSLFLEMPRKPMNVFIDGLKDRGFEITDFDPQNLPTPDNTDLLLYVFAVESALGLSHIFIDWNAEQKGFDGIMARFWNEVPTMMVSFGHPYYLRDAPRVPTYVNAYSTIEASQRAALSCIIGNQPFSGSSPVDAFAGVPDAQY